ncbi:MAG TPA: hypothetical protein VNJ08_07450 [Bacteriovoracaceae bacterium]|nr:hypothetical protein [Bacteriovoracaceae bacterium]
MLSVLFYLGLIAVLCLWVEGALAPMTNSLIIRRNPGEQLDDWLKSFRWGNRSQLNEKIDLPHYKFYSEIALTLLSLARKMGGNYQESLLFLRDGLQSDRQFEKKMHELRLGCWLQMLLIMALTWAFMLGALSLVDIKISGLKLGLIAIWQMIGLCLLPLTLAYLRKKLFGDIGRLWKMLFTLSSMVRVPLSRSEIFAMADIKGLDLIKQKSLLHLVDKLKHTCQQALKQGGSYEGEVKYLMEELRFQEKWHFELFEKRLTMLKLGLLSIFFLPAYLSFIFMLLGDLMTLM